MKVIAFSASYYRVSNNDGVTFASAVLIPNATGKSRGVVTDDQLIWIAGHTKGIERSGDGGSSWSRVFTYEATSTTEDACFSDIDEDKIWMVGRYARVYYSPDRGINWSKIWQAPSALSSDYIYAIHMISNTIGWMCGNISTVDGLKKSVWKTTDGGVNWTIQKGDFPTGPYDMFAVDANTIYLLCSTTAGHIWKSTNGGTTWVDKGIGSRTRAGGRIFAIGDNVWMTGKDNVTLEVMYSVDGGTNWTRVEVADSTPYAAAERTPILFLSANIGYVGTYMFYKTTDGGQTWNWQGGYSGQSTTSLTTAICLNPAILTQFRSFNVAGSAPADRTSEGSAVTQANPLNFGQMAKGNDSNVKCVIWRATNLGAYSTLSNMRFWAYDLSEFVGTNTYHADITDSWTTNKTPAQVKAGTPGTCPQAEPAANLTKIGGGNITGVGHTDTSQYIYLVNNIGNDETDGNKNFVYRVMFDYA